MLRLKVSMTIGLQRQGSYSMDPENYRLRVETLSYIPYQLHAIYSVKGEAHKGNSSIKTKPIYVFSSELALQITFWMIDLSLAP